MVVRRKQSVQDGLPLLLQARNPLNFGLLSGALDAPARLQGHTGDHQECGKAEGAECPESKTRFRHEPHAGRRDAELRQHEIAMQMLPLFE